MIKMKNKLITLLLLPLLTTGCAGGQKGYVLNESTFFLVMTNIQYYPEEYVNNLLNTSIKLKLDSNFNISNSNFALPSCINLCSFI